MNRKEYIPANLELILSVDVIATSGIHVEAVDPDNGYGELIPLH